MSNRIYYFSGTGNSLAVARQLASEIGDTEVVAIAQGLKKDISMDVERLGIVFPVYMWGPPLQVARFARRLAGPTSAYVFAVATYGGMPAATLPLLAKLLREQNITLSAGFGVLMPGNYIPLYDIKPVETVNRCIGNAKSATSAIAAAVKDRKAGPIKANNPLVNALFTGLIYRFSSPHIPRMDESFRVTDKCDGCNGSPVCEAVCPARNIRMADSKPIWRHGCEQCLACLHLCPQQAIEYGRKTEGRRRYHHPDTAIADFRLR